MKTSAIRMLKPTKLRLSHSNKGDNLKRIHLASNAAVLAAKAGRMLVIINNNCLGLFGVLGEKPWD